jgi:hypothetical protein
MKTVSVIILIRPEAVRTMAATRTAAIASLFQVFRCEYHEPVFPIEINAFDKRVGHYGRISTGVPSGTSVQISSIS